MTTIICKDEPYSWELPLLDFLNEGNVPEDWWDFFEKKEVQEELLKISNFLQEEYKNGEIIYPDIYNVFRTFILPPEKIKVVILGMDPYHNGNAVGLCFSVKRGERVNPSLNNIYIELEKEGFEPEKNGELDSWLKQGCFLLNSALTVRKAEAGSHVSIWYNFTRMLLEYISENTQSIAWLIMGKDAYEKISEIKTPSLFVTSHPSHFSAYNPFRHYPAFMGSGVFTKINQYLISHGKTEILW